MSARPISDYEIQLRKDCLGEAVRLGRDRGDNDVEVLESARRFLAFALGENEKTPRQKIIEALDGADVR